VPRVDEIEPGSGPATSPRLSIVVTSYNHEAYVAQCLDSYLAQQVDFPVEIIVSDDASTDGTPAIVAEYAARFPDLVHAILRPENVGLNASLGDALLAARGEYVTLSDGDDYLTDPEKLRRQVAYMDAHPDNAVNFHPVQVRWEGEPGEGTEFPPAAWRDDLSLPALVARNFIQVNSAVYRRLPSYVDVLPLDLTPQDWYLHIRHAQHGTIAMMPETMSVYRRHSQAAFALAHSDPAGFWTRHGAGHAAFCEAVLDLFPGDAEIERLLSPLAGRVFGALAAIADDPASSDADRALLASVSRRRPRAAALGARGLQTKVSQLDDRLTAATAEIGQLQASAVVAGRRITRQKERLDEQRARIKELRERVKILRARSNRISAEPQASNKSRLRAGVRSLRSRLRSNRVT
jgi:hypothetical protein